MVLSLKRWKSRTPQGFAASAQEQNPFTCLLASADSRPALADTGPHRPLGDAGWSSPVASQAHHQKDPGSQVRKSGGEGTSVDVRVDRSRDRVNRKKKKSK